MEIIQWQNLVPSGESVHAVRSKRTYREPVTLHGHDFSELFWIDLGEACHTLNGHSELLTAGSLVLVRPNDRHSIEPKQGSPILFTNIAFSAETFHFIQQRYLTNCVPRLQRARQEHPVKIEPSCISLFNRWADELANGPRTQLHVDRFLLNVFAELDPDRHMRIPEGTPDWLETACRKIASPDQLSAGTEAFMRLAGRSREHVARSCQLYLGMTPTAYVNQARMNYAAHRLEMSNATILDIALDCGIENLSHFYTLFRGEFGTTPRAYRLTHRRPT